MRKVILVVDDEPKNVKLLVDILNASGYKTVSAAKGEKAIELALSKQPDLIILDIHLPDVDGFEVAARLKNDPATRNIPIIALSGGAMPEDEKKAMDAGLDAYVTKPFNIGWLRSLVARKME